MFRIFFFFYMFTCCSAELAFVVLFWISGKCRRWSWILDCRLEISDFEVGELGNSLTLSLIWLFSYVHLRFPFLGHQKGVVIYVLFSFIQKTKQRVLLDVSNIFLLRAKFYLFSIFEPGWTLVDLVYCLALHFFFSMQVISFPNFMYCTFLFYRVGFAHFHTYGIWPLL